MNLSSVFIRRMQPQDLERVHEIDCLSFSLPWPKKSFEFELMENDVAWCWIAEVPHQVFHNLVVGLAVVWQIVDEAHIATIAVHPDYRAKGIGKKLMATLLYHAKQAGMQSATLEVRETNEIAQAMYHKFGFKVKGRRPRYYHDTNEDALIMSLELTT
jgi:ribosomal-protein-alanine N-acetyltransferase